MKGFEHSRNTSVNFSGLSVSVPVTDDVPEQFSWVRGRSFPTAEHLFHAMKYVYSDVLKEGWNCYSIKLIR